MTDNEVARQDEVLAALTRILRREATESAIAHFLNREEGISVTAMP